MSSVAEIERAIEQLSPQDFRALSQWVADRDAEAWDRQFEADVPAGKLDALAGEALAELRAGWCPPPPPVTHRTTARFWQRYNALPEAVQRVADANYELLKADLRHPSLHLKQVGRFWSVRVGFPLPVGSRSGRRRPRLVLGRPARRV